jgi:hypothetical protein
MVLVVDKTQNPQRVLSNFLSFFWNFWNIWKLLKICKTFSGGSANLLFFQSGIVRTRNRSGIGRNSWNWKEFLGIPTNSGITTYMGLFANHRSWLSIEFRYGILGIGSNFHWFPRIPESQLTWAYLRMIGRGYRSNSATEFPEFERLGID